MRKNSLFPRKPKVRDLAVLQVPRIWGVAFWEGRELGGEVAGWRQPGGPR